MDQREALPFPTGLRLWSPGQTNAYVTVHWLTTSAPDKELKFHKLCFKGEKSSNSLEIQGQRSESQLHVKQYLSHLLCRNQGKKEGQRVGTGQSSGGVSFLNSYSLGLCQGKQASKEHPSMASASAPASWPAWVPVMTSFGDEKQCGSVSWINPFLPNLLLGHDVLCRNTNLD